jgi:hypothetical protein
MEMVSIKNLYWLAGLMEGEGHFGRQPNQIVITLAMTDRDVVMRAAGMFAIGHCKERKLPSGKIAYIWHVTNQTHAAGLMMTLLPLMGARRASKIRECLAFWQARRGNNKHFPTCRHGHSFSGDNLRIVQEGKYTKRRCRECIKLRMRKHRAKAEDYVCN